MVSISVQRRSHWGTNIGEHSQYIKLKSKEGWGGEGVGFYAVFIHCRQPMWCVPSSVPLGFFNTTTSNVQTQS